MRLERKSDAFFPEKYLHGTERYLVRRVAKSARKERYLLEIDV